MHRLILVVGDAKPNIIQKKLGEIVKTIQEQTGLIPGWQNIHFYIMTVLTIMYLIKGIEKLSAREFIGVNGTLETDPEGTDVWFYVINPETDEILPRNHSLVKRYVLTYCKS